jgi:2-(1,2-epoxy-1,2-dihydrophenyl)acetyl-CoA isomerase
MLLTVWNYEDFIKKEESMEETIKLEMANQIAKVILNKPKNYNAFDLEMITNFANIIIPLATNKLVYGVIITGTGKAFCAGGDLNWALNFKEGPSSHTGNPTHEQTGHGSN